jgi:hypothetical protein
MHIYDDRVGEFIPHANAATFADRLSKNFHRRYGQHASESEIKSWKHSLHAFADALDGAGMDDAWVVLEYQLPLSSSRIDALLLGRDADSRANAVLLEFKQWDGCEEHYVPDAIRLGGEEKLHPSAQVRAYRRYLQDTHAVFTDGGAQLHSCAFLHNVRDSSGSSFYADRYATLLADSPSFSADRVSDLSYYVSERTRFGTDPKFVDSVLASGYRPSRTLLANVADSIHGHEPWQLLDEQLLVFNRIMADIESSHRAGRKRVICVTGGPGSGKSVIAVQAVGAAAARGYAIAHATGSKAFTTNLRGIVGPAADLIFRYTHNFRDAKPNSIDLVICDEAHRLREKTQFGPSIYSKTPQLQEIINASKVSVFLLDPRQSIRLNETGSINNVRAYAKQQGIPITEYSLDLQFRCAGSESYINWIEGAFALEAQTSAAWHHNGDYEVRLFDSPHDLEQAIRARARQGHAARLVAGFCWPWSDPRTDGSLVPDVTIGNWSMPWNRKPADMWKKRGPAPKPENHPYTIWATQSSGLDEVGCIYSAQGFEFDYVGVIVGNDLRWDPERRRWFSDLSQNEDSGFKSGITRDRDLAVQQLAHVYRVLSTRGMKGTYFYFLDPNTHRHFEELLAQP